MAKYVPPSRRAGYVPPAASDLPPTPHSSRGSRAFARERPDGEGTVSINTVSRHFTHWRDSTLTFFNHSGEPVPRPPRAPYDPCRTPRSTPLPPSPPPPPPAHPLAHLVSYITLFPAAHPLWKDKAEMWMHTGAAKMIEDFEGGRRNFGRPIPMFRSFKASNIDMEWHGWWYVFSVYRWLMCVCVIGGHPSPDCA